MSARVSGGQVKDVIETSLEEAVILGSMINTANLYVDTHLLTVGHTDAVLERIELYLAAHIVALTEERGSLKGGKFGDSSEFLADVFDDGFRATRYGQMAITLDTSGTLASLGRANMKAQFTVV